jgi:LytS/YehU family sensor histidine kinase
MLYFSVLSMLRDADGSLIFTIGAIMLVFGALFDTLYYYQLINTGIFLSLGLVGFAGTQTLLLALYFSKVEQDRQTLKKKLLVTDLSLLRAQIRPHFIYNALGTISSAISRNPAEAKALLLDFSDFLRGCFSTEREDGLTSLSSELNTVRAYLSLEKARFRDRLNVIYDLAEDESRFVPILSVQPIVENAVRHGLMPKIDGGTVKIRTWHDGGQTHIVVEDDGIGILKDDILTGPQSLNDTGNGIGLPNINRRLKILYDTQLIIDSRPWHGTRVEIVLPASHREEDIL